MVNGVRLRNPHFAGLLAWFFPGLGHWYQGRRAKAVLYSVCILSTFCFGVYLGEGRVVYAAWGPAERRLPYLCQVGVGLPALPALAQYWRYRGETPDRGLQRLNRIRRLHGEEAMHFHADPDAPEATLGDWFMVPPNHDARELDYLHKRLHRMFELGTVYTMIAGLLNILAIYDCLGGPAYGDDDEAEEKPQTNKEPTKPPPDPAPVA